MRTYVLAAAALGMIATPLAAADLQVNIDGVVNENGAVMVALHRAVEGVEFPDEASTVAAQWRNARGGTMHFVFPDLAPGRYAVAVFHDEDGDGELDSNAIGIPSEGYGFSEEAVGSFGPPTFDQAAVTIDGEAATIETKVTLSY